MTIGTIQCAYCDFIATHPTEMEEHRDDVHGDDIEAFKDKENERYTLRRHKANNY